MFYYCYYPSPIGQLRIISDDESLFCIEKVREENINPLMKSAILNESQRILRLTKEWLNSYFSKEKPSVEKLPIHLTGTPFQVEVYQCLLKIPYGETRCYQDIANQISEKTHKRMSCQAVGTAVSHNPLLIVVPCHRVIHKNGNISGFAIGEENKKFLLNIEETLY